MRLRKTRTTSFSVKVDGQHVTINVSQHKKMLWNIGASVHKSRRCQRDWYNDYRNKRSRSVELDRSKKTTRQIFAMVKLLRKVIDRCPDKNWLMITSQDLSAHGWRYVERLGFTPCHCYDELLWILRVDREEEVHGPSKSTT